MGVFKHTDSQAHSWEILTEKFGKGPVICAFKKRETALACVVQSVGVSSCELKGQGLDSWSEHEPGLLVLS